MNGSVVCIHQYNKKNNPKRSFDALRLRPVQVETQTTVAENRAHILLVRAYNKSS